jgi:hypothetical protein
MTGHHTSDLPRAVQRALAQLGPDPAALAFEGRQRLVAAVNAADAGLYGHAIRLTGIGQGFFTLAARIAEG